MPKVIKNVRESLTAETRRQITENGYSDTSMRSVATACGIATGTVYNYFESKDALVASFMNEDWAATLESMRKKCKNAKSPLEAIGFVSSEMTEFARAHHKLFSDPQASVGYSITLQKGHAILVDQLVSIIDPLCSQYSTALGTNVSEFIVETMLTWTVQGKDFKEYFKVIAKIFE